MRKTFKILILIIFLFSIKNTYSQPFRNTYFDSIMNYTFSGEILIKTIEKTDTIETTKISTLEDIRIILIDTLESQLNVHETSYNRGIMVDKYNIEVDAVLGSSWCASFVGSNLSWQGIPNPHSAYSPDYALKKDIIWKNKRKNNETPLSGDVITLYYNNLGRVGHTGFYKKTDKNGYFITIEGNTNVGGSRNGDGVYLKKRDPKKIHAISRFIK